MLKLKKIVNTLLVILSILIIGSIFPVEAANLPFTDVEKGSWYYEPLVVMYNNQIIKGFEDNTFRPNYNFTYAQILTILCRMENIDLTGYDNSTWYSAPAEYFRTNYEIYTDDYQKPISRREIFRYIVKFYNLSLSQERLQEIASEPPLFADENNVETYIMHDCGILAGITKDDGKLYVDGGSNLTYAQATTILYRIIANGISKNTNIVINNQVSQDNQNNQDNQDNQNNQNNMITVTLYEPYNTLSYTSNLGNDKDIIETLGYLMYRSIDEYRFTVETTMSEEIANSYLKKFSADLDIAMNKYGEYSCFLDKTDLTISYNSKSLNLDLDFQYNVGIENGLSVDEQKRSFEENCKNTVLELYSTGLLSDSMSNREKALAIYRFVDHNFEYDTSHQNFNGYRFWRDGKGVCSAYAATYAYMCKLVNLDAVTVSGYAEDENGEKVAHAWVRIKDGNNYVYCDPTYGDPLPNRENFSDEKWFWLSEKDMIDHYMEEVCYKY